MTPKGMLMDISFERGSWWPLTNPHVDITIRTMSTVRKTFGLSAAMKKLMD